MSRSQAARLDRLPEETITESTELARFCRPQRHQAKRASGQKQTIGVDVILPVAFPLIDVKQRAVEPMHAARGRAHVGSRPFMELYHRLDVVRIVPVVRIE